MSTMTKPSAPLSAKPAIPPAGPFWWVGIAGAALLLIGSLLSWSYVPGILGDLSIDFYPAALQVFSIVMAVLAILALLARRSGWGRRINSEAALRMLGIGALAFMVVVIGAIALQAKGLINVNPGGWVALVGSVLILVAALRMTPRPAQPLYRATAPSWVEILVIVGLLAAVLFLAAFVLGLDDAAEFIAVLVAVILISMAAVKAGVGEWLSVVAAKHRPVLMLGALAVAFLFPFTQNGSDANMSIATQILIFATTALGLNIVVGLAGLLDLGYIAFLGAGAYVGAMMSHSAYATIGWKPNFLVVMLCGAIFSSILGLIIGSPTLRVSGDYLAIVTLAFGEIFRLAVNNLNGSNGPDITHGPNGIPGIPELELWGFNFGQPHTVFGITLGRFANYYFLLLLLAALVITVFVRLNNSRLGRGWIAIREDERAAEAMGVNIFGLKLFAFAGGAFLAGLAGTVKAHHDISVSPDQYIFLESAFLLAAVVLGGMGTVAGVLVGASVLKMLPEKLRFFSEYRLLIFGLLLILMMRFRPEGMIPSKRRALEFHDDDEELADRIEDVHLETTAETDPAAGAARA